MKTHNKYAVIGLKALKRAATKVFEDAKINNYKIPIWKNGRIEYETSEINTQESIPLDAHKLDASEQDRSLRNKTNILQ